MFGAVCINVVAKCYKFINGLKLAITDTTLNEMIRTGEVEQELRSLTPLFVGTHYVSWQLPTCGRH